MIFNVNMRNMSMVKYQRLRRTGALILSSLDIFHCTHLTLIITVIIYLLVVDCHDV